MSRSATAHDARNQLDRRVPVPERRRLRCRDRCSSWLSRSLPAARGRPPAAGRSVAEAIDQVQPKIVKIYGAGGFRGLEAYQSGLLISPEGHVLTVWSYVLDTDYITVTLDDGRKFEAKLLGADPRLEVAVLKIDAAGPALLRPEPGRRRSRPATRVLAFSNLFGVATGDEPASVQHGVVSVKTQLEARRGVFETPYRRPGLRARRDDQQSRRRRRGAGHPARRAGGHAGQGTAQRAEQHLAQLRRSHRRAPRVGRRDPRRQVRRPRRTKQPDEAGSGRWTLAMLGIVLVPDVLERTPPYVDDVRAGSPAAAAGVRPDDLILLLGDRLIQSCKALRERAGVRRLRGPDHADRAPRAGTGGVRRCKPPTKTNRSRHDRCDETCPPRPIVAWSPAAGVAAAPCCRAPTPPAADDDDVELLEQQAFRAAVDRVAPSVVRIETVGGLERVGEVLFGTGPTTGLVVDPDGYIVSSAFNFVNQPDSILVRLPDGTPQAGPSWWPPTTTACSCC